MLKFYARKIKYLIFVGLFIFFAVKLSSYLKGTPAKAYFNYNEEKIKAINHGTWERELRLGLKQDVVVQWNFTKESITMLVTGRTKGYVAVGFTHSPGMEDSDIVIGWVKDGQTFIKDLYGVENGRPREDQQNNYDLLFGSENETHTSFCFHRLLDTCDENDLEITMSTFDIMWAINDKDPEGSSIDDILYHNRKRGMKKIGLLYIAFSRPALTSDIDTFDIVSPKITVTKNSNTFYWYCQLKEIPKFQEPRHIVGYEGIYTPGNEKYVHHTVLYFCSPLIPTDDEAKAGHRCLMDGNIKRLLVAGLCRRLFGGVTLGDYQHFFKSDVGIPFGSTDEKTMYIFFEIHYNTGGLKKKSFVDGSGIRLYHTSKLRLYSSGPLLVFHRFFQVIPPRASDFPTSSICSSKCTKEVFPKEGITIFGIFFHAHYLARKMVFSQYRNGKEINRVADDYYDFEYQNIRFLKEEIKVLPNDTLVFECIYNSSATEDATTTGMDSTDEMCIAVLFMTPPLDHVLCWSTLISTEYNRIFPQIPTIKQGSSSFSFGWQIYHSVGIRLFSKFRKWTETETTALRIAMRDGYHSSQCHFDEATDVIEDIVKLPNISAVTKENNCKNLK